MPVLNQKRAGLTVLTLALLGSAWLGPMALPAYGAASPDAVQITDLASALAQAQAERRGGDPAAATKILSQLVLGAPDDARVLGEYGKTLIDEGRSDDALAFLERAIELNPGDWTLYSAQGVAYDQKGQYQAAQASYGRALNLKPGEPTVLSNTALSHMQAGDLDGAERLLLQAAPNGAAYPKIAQNLALVESLKASRPAAAAEPTTAVAALPKPLAASVAATAPINAPKPPAMAATPAPTPVTSMPLSAPAATKPPLPLSGLAALMADPRVRIQALPKDDETPKSAALSSKTKPGKTIAKAAATEKLAADRPQNPKTVALRPALSDSDRPTKTDAKKQD